MLERRLSTASVSASAKVSLSSVSIMSRTPNLCVYCGLPGRTREHYWGRWLQRRIPQIHSETRHMTTRHDLLTGNVTMKKGALTRQGNIRNQQIKAPCSNCNSGWMKRTNEAAKDVILKLAEEGPMPLGAAERLVFSTWSVMFSMTYEFADLTTLVTSQAERTYLMDTGRPPTDWAVLIGLFVGEDWKEIHNHRALVTWGEGGIPDHPNAQCNTFTLGRCAVVTLSGEVARGRTLESFSRRNGLRALWPVSMGERGGSIPLTDEAMWAIARFDQ